MPRLLCLLLTGGLLDAQEVPGSNEVLVHPKAAPGPLDNPLKGYCVYTNAGKIHRPYSMVFHYVPWRQLEPTEGQYAFEAWEKQTWETPIAAGKHVVLRVYADYPRKLSAIPDWLLSKGITQTPYKDYGGGLGPD